MTEPDATKIYESISKVARGMEFRMELHREKGGWQDRVWLAQFEDVLRDLHDFYKALVDGNPREIMNEGLDTMNMIWMVINNLPEAWQELEQVQDFRPLLEEIREKEEAKVKG